MPWGIEGYKPIMIANSARFSNLFCVLVLRRRSWPSSGIDFLWLWPLLLLFCLFFLCLSSPSFLLLYIYIFFFFSLSLSISLPLSLSLSLSLSISLPLSVIIWSKFGVFESFYLVQVGVFESYYLVQVCAFSLQKWWFQAICFAHSVIILCFFLCPIIWQFSKNSLFQKKGAKIGLFNFQCFKFKFWNFSLFLGC